MVQRKTFGEKLFDVAVCVLVLIISAACLYPMLYVLFASISDPVQLVSFSGMLIKPLGFSLAGYEAVLNNANIYIGYGNTLFYVIVGTCLNMIMTILGAYALAMTGYKFKKQITLGIVVTMYVTGGMIPNYLLIKILGLLNTRLAIILPVAIATWNMIVMRTSFSAIPKSLEEAGRIDGANDFIILFKIYLPLAKATLAVMVLFYSVGHWNSWFTSMLYLPSDRTKWPLQLFLREILLANASTDAAASSSADSTLFLDEVMKYAMVIISTVPILCVYPFIQKYFNKGVMMGSLKG